MTESIVCQDPKNCQRTDHAGGAGGTLVHLPPDGVIVPGHFDHGVPSDANEPPAALSIPWPPDEATVEKVARAGYESVNYRHSHTWDDDAEPTRDRWRTVARAVLDALGGDR